MNEITYLLYQKCHLKLFLLGLVAEVIFQAPLCIAKHVFSQTEEPDCKANTPYSSRNCIKKYCYTIMLNSPPSHLPSIAVFCSKCRFCRVCKEEKMFVPTPGARGRGNFVTNLFSSCCLIRAVCKRWEMCTMSVNVNFLHGAVNTVNSSGGGRETAGVHCVS